MSDSTPHSSKNQTNSNILYWIISLNCTIPSL